MSEEQTEATPQYLLLRDDNNWPDWCSRAQLVDFLHTTMKPYEDQPADIDNAITYAFSGEKYAGGFIMLVESSHCSKPCSITSPTSPIAPRCGNTRSPGFAKQRANLVAVVSGTKTTPVQDNCPTSTFLGPDFGGLGSQRCSQVTEPGR